MKINWVNSWRAGNKKEAYKFSLRVGVLTIIEISYAKKFRFMILNLGFEI